MQGDKAHSESNLQDVAMEKTPPNYVSMRSKRRRADDYGFDLDEFKEEIRDMIKSLMTDQESDIKKIYPTLQEIQLTNQKIENSISFISSQNEEFKKKIEELESQARKDKEHIFLLEEKIEEMQRSCRKTSIEIKNVPKTNNETTEDLTKLVICLSKTIECPITKSDIRDIFRVQGKKDRKMNNNLPIIVETNSAILKTEILKKCKAYNIKQEQKLCAKNLGFTTNQDTPIYVSEQLTAKGSRLHFLARDLKKSKSYKFCWTAYGKVYVKKDEDSPAIRINNEAQIHKLLQGE